MSNEQDAMTEALLARLTPAAAAVDPVAAAYAAGRAAGRRGVRAGWSTAAVAGVVAVAGWAGMVHRPSSRAERSDVPEAMAEVTVEASPVVPGNAVQLRAMVLARGLDALPRTPVPVSRPWSAYGPG